MDPTLRRQACTHASYAHEHPGAPHNERLEWLGDAVLQLHVSNHLYRTFPHADEAELSRRRSAMVCNEHLATLLSNDEKSSVRVGGSMHNKDHTRLLSGVYEALVGAAFLSGANLSNHLQPLLASSPPHAACDNVVSKVQELEQKVTKQTPNYRYFGDECELDVWWGCFRAAGNNKKTARKAAAREALAQYPISE